jgi:hypothetical protein
VPRLPGLHERPTRPVAAPRPAGHLLEQLKGALRGARIARSKADVRVEHADQRHPRKVVALGDELRADHDVDLTRRNRGELRAQPLRAAWEVAREHDRALARKELGDFLGDALDPRPARDERVERAAGRAGVRARLGVAAMMAHERTAEAVLDEPGRAVRAFVAMGAGAAERERRVAPAVEE